MNERTMMRSELLDVISKCDVIMGYYASACEGDTSMGREGMRRARSLAQFAFNELFPNPMPPSKKKALNGFLATGRMANWVSVSDGVTRLGTLFTDNELNEYDNNNKIGCIKLVRARTGMGLKETKEFVEEHLEWEK